MSRPLALAVVCTILVIPHVSGGSPRAKSPLAEMEAKWKVEFANAVVEECEIRADGSVSVVELKRTSTGKIEAKAGSFVITYADDRLERWTAVGNKFVVEHWSSATQVPVVTPVLGIAECVERVKQEADKTKVKEVVRRLVGPHEVPNREQIAKQVDFSKEDVLYVNWSGVADDELEPTLEGAVVLFTFTPGHCKNKETHHLVFALAKNAEWRLVEKHKSQRHPEVIRISNAEELANTIPPLK